MTGIELIAEERRRQIEEECWGETHDDDHEIGELSMAASCYAMNASGVIETTFYGLKVTEHDVVQPEEWPWEEKWWKPTPNDPVRQLVKAGALIAAEIDRLQRAR